MLSFIERICILQRPPAASGHVYVIYGYAVPFLYFSDHSIGEIYFQNLDLLVTSLKNRYTHSRIELMIATLNFYIRMDLL